MVKWRLWGRVALVALLLNLSCYLLAAAADPGPRINESWQGLSGREVQLLAPGDKTPQDNEPAAIVRRVNSGPEVLIQGQEAQKEASQLAATLRLTPTTELKLSFLYRQDPTGGSSGSSGSSHLLMQYSMDYLVMPNLRVGLHGYLYKPPTEYQYWRSVPSEFPQHGFGPGLKYDLGRWSFLLRSQLEAGTKDHRETLHNWFRVWYSF